MALPELIILDVGHGNCALLRDTEAITIIDCAPGPTLIDTLDDLGIHEIEHVLLSHADTDHIGGIAGLLRNARLVVRNIYVNADAAKTTRSWYDFRIAVREARERSGTRVHTALTTTQSRLLVSGEVTIEVLAPLPEQILGGSGARGVDRRRLDTNSVSVVIRLVHRDHGIALLPGDLDAGTLDGLLAAATDLTASLLVFPHHGGRPGRSDSRIFAERLSEVVQPRLVIFSISRERFKNPQPDIVQGIRRAIPEAHILCTQLSQRCAALPLANAIFDHLTPLAAQGRALGSCCGGTVVVRIDGANTNYTPLARAHRGFIRGQGVPTPLCLRQYF